MDTAGSFFARVSVMEPREFLEVCGALAPLMGSVVEVLHFQRFDRFWEIVNENPELSACRGELLAKGYDTTTDTTSIMAVCVTIMSVC